MRIAIFTDVNTITPARLIRATLRATRQHPSCRVVGFVTTCPDDFRVGMARRVGNLGHRAVVAATNSDVPLRSLFESGLDLFLLARRCGIPVLVPDGGDLNAPAFIDDLMHTLQPDMALSFYCRHRFKRPLRSAFAQTVNYHDALLPDYRGVMSTAFSIYAGEAQSGLTFHHMSASFDRGPILLQDAVPIDESSSLDQVVRRKSARAAALVPRLLELLSAGDPGRPQDREGSYFSAHEGMAMTHLSRPENATSREILRRIRAFGLLHLTIDGRTYPVTRVRTSRSRSKRFFRTADARLLRPDRFRGLPALFYRPGRSRTE